MSSLENELWKLERAKERMKILKMLTEISRHASNCASHLNLGWLQEAHSNAVAMLKISSAVLNAIERKEEEQ